MKDIGCYTALSNIKKKTLPIVFEKAYSRRIQLQINQINIRQNRNAPHEVWHTYCKTAIDSQIYVL